MILAQGYTNGLTDENNWAVETLSGAQLEIHTGKKVKWDPKPHTTHKSQFLGGL